MKLLVIGLDGATFSLIKRWASRGYLPTIQRLMENGVHSDLISTIPPVSSPAWPSFMTGKNPGKHGLYDFVGRGDGYSREIKNAKDLKTKTIWKILSDSGKTCIVVNVPVTYPPQKIKGCLVSGILTPPDACYVNPSELHQELKAIGYQPGNAIHELGRNIEAKRLINHILGVTAKQIETVSYLMEKYDWQFCMLVLSGTDMVQHYLWQHHKDMILQYYQRVDASIKALLKKVDDETNVFLMSDHGFGPVYKTFHVNSFLHKLDLLHFRTEKHAGEYVNKKDYRAARTRLQELLLKLGITKETVYSWVNRLHAIGLLQKVYKKFRLQIPTTVRSIDWERTQAFFNSTIGPAASIEINLEGRQPNGIVREEDYDKTVDLIIKALLEVEDPERQEKIVGEAFRRETIYHGPYVSDAPDITFLTRDFEYGTTERIYGDRLVSEPVHKGRGTHRMNGIFVAYGPDIKEKRKLQNSRLIDLAPTILHMFDLAIPKEMDGRVLKSIFKTESNIGKRSVKFHSIDEKERVSDRIKGLKRAHKI